MLSAKEFRSKLATGRKYMLESERDLRKDHTLTLRLLGKGDEEVDTVEMDVKLHPMTATDYYWFNSMQFKPDAKGAIIEQCTSYTAAVIAGTRDENGDHIFSEADIPTLEHPYNIQQILAMSAKIMIAASISEAQQTVEKPS